MKSIFIILSDLPSFIVFLYLFVPVLILNIIPFGTTLSVIILLSWLYALGITLQKMLPSGVVVTKKWFILCMIYTPLYSIVFDIYFEKSFPMAAFPFHFIAVNCIFYILFFVSRGLVITEEKKQLSIDRYIGTFILLWFFPIGVWFIHPRFRKIVKSKHVIVS